MKKIIRSIFSGIGVVVFLVIALAQCAEVSKPMPDNAVVLVDDQQKLYHSPMHFRDDSVEKPTNLRITTAGEARAKDYNSDPTCNGRDYFSQQRGSLLRATLSDWTGFASKPRWNEDGTWNW